MKRDWRRLAPVGVDGQGQWHLLLVGLLLAWLWSLGFFGRYLMAYRKLFYLDAWDNSVLNTGAEMEPFWDLAGGSLLGFRLVFLASGLLAWHYYRYHGTGSKSIYLMKRLSDPWELHRRCWSIPLMGMAAAIGAAAVTVGLYALFYARVTPPECLPGR